MPATHFESFPHTSDLIAYSWIFEEVKRQSGVGEAIYAYDLSTGALVAQWHEARPGADLTSALEDALRAGAEIVLHHNHPSNGSFIPLDLQTLVGQNPHHPNLPSLAAMWAHGNAGPRYRIALTDPTHASAVVAADHFLTKLQAKLSHSAGGHEIFEAGWRHLVCLCLERKGYVTYEYDLSGFPNYGGPAQRLDWAADRLTMRDAFPVACAVIVDYYGSEF